MNYPRKYFIAEYSAIKNAIHHCYTDDHIAYHRYGGRGITVKDELCGPDALDLLIDVIGPRPTDKHSLDRVDNDGDYNLNPLNLRWADRKTQQTNRRKQAQVITDYGYGIGLSNASAAAKRGGRPSALLPYQGRTKTIADWALELGMKNATIRQRMDRGLTPEQALNPSTSRPGEKRKNPRLATTMTPHVELLDQTTDPLKTTIDAWITQASKAVSDIESRPN